jgi:hypothetical protein
VFVVLDRLNSVLFPDSLNKDGEFLFKIPKGSISTVIAYTQDNDRHYFGMKKLLSNQPLLKLSQEEMQIKKIKEIVATLR